MENRKMQSFTFAENGIVTTITPHTLDEERALWRKWLMEQDTANTDTPAAVTIDTTPTITPEKAKAICAKAAAKAAKVQKSINKTAAHREKTIAKAEREKVNNAKAKAHGKYKITIPPITPDNIGNVIETMAKIAYWSKYHWWMKSNAEAFKAFDGKYAYGTPNAEDMEQAAALAIWETYITTPDTPTFGKNSLFVAGLRAIDRVFDASSPKGYTMPNPEEYKTMTPAEKVKANARAAKTYNPTVFPTAYNQPAPENPSAAAAVRAAIENADLTDTQRMIIAAMANGVKVSDIVLTFAAKRGAVLVDKPATVYGNDGKPHAGMVKDFPDDKARAAWGRKMRETRAAAYRAIVQNLPENVADIVTSENVADYLTATRAARKAAARKAETPEQAAARKAANAARMAAKRAAETPEQAAARKAANAERERARRAARKAANK